MHVPVLGLKANSWLTEPPRAQTMEVASFSWNGRTSEKDMPAIPGWGGDNAMKPWRVVHLAPGDGLRLRLRSSENGADGQHPNGGDADGELFASVAGAGAAIERTSCSCMRSLRAESAEWCSTVEQEGGSSSIDRSKSVVKSYKMDRNDADASATGTQLSALTRSTRMDSPVLPELLLQTSARVDRPTVVAPRKAV